MNFVGCRCNMFMKFSIEHTRKVHTILQKGKPWPVREIHTKSTCFSPVKLAYASYESTARNIPFETAEASPVLIVHGLFGSKSNWNSLSKTISEKTGRKVIAADLRNHGDSPHSSKSAYNNMADDIILLLKDLGIEKVTVIGHSMGGGIVIYLTLNYPELVEKMVVLDISPITRSPKTKSIKIFFEILKKIRLEQNISSSEAYRMADQQLSAFVNVASIREHLLQNLVEEEPGKYKWRLNLPVLEKHFDIFFNFPRINKTFNGPTLFIGGGRSDHLPTNDHEKIKDLFPAAKFQYIPEAGHWLHEQKPQEFIDIVVPFINETV